MNEKSDWIQCIDNEETIEYLEKYHKEMVLKKFKQLTISEIELLSYHLLREDSFKSLKSLTLIGKTIDFICNNACEKTIPLFT